MTDRFVKYETQRIRRCDNNVERPVLDAENRMWVI